MTNDQAPMTNGCNCDGCDFTLTAVPPVSVQTSRHLDIVLEVFRTLEKKTARGGVEQKLYEHACAHLATLMQFVLSVEMPLDNPNAGELFIVGQTTSECGSIWLFQGVFDSREKAIAACRDARYFVGPATLNVSLPPDKSLWPGAFNPLRP